MTIYQWKRWTPGDLPQKNRQVQAAGVPPNRIVIGGAKNHEVKHMVALLARPVAVESHLSEAFQDDNTPGSLTFLEVPKPFL